MSFDLGVWFEPARITGDAATEKYVRLCEGDATGLVEPPAVGAFHAELTAEFPDLDELDDAAGSPWSAALTVSESHVLMSMIWSRADEMAARVVELAHRHGLVCFDPQSATLHLPPALRLPAALRLERCVGQPVTDPSPDVLERAVRRLSGSNWFLILEAGEQRYVQIGLGPSAGVEAGWFALEHRDGSPDRHVRALVRDRGPLVTALLGFAAGDRGWADGFSWTKLDLS
ncbi:hypothetical protein Pth03_65020 [Planotetraspora thailandica]|uniref:Uncharacterized protein n=1 Tax=Planotetraspora thailandica TaxID=487172 RepID=A0A8J3XZN8_9ACTN|nr:hypothetical protein [Planotetraspora thailandica]GII58113.1 hypothetical protein Pth03_65020 [Planotetraspora thailandica]